MGMRSSAAREAGERNGAQPRMAPQRRLPMSDPDPQSRHLGPVILQHQPEGHDAPRPEITPQIGRFSGDHNWPLLG